MNREKYCRIKHWSTVRGASLQLENPTNDRGWDLKPICKFVVLSVCLWIVKQCVELCDQATQVPSHFHLHVFTDGSKEKKRLTKFCWRNCRSRPMQQTAQLALCKCSVFLRFLKGGWGRALGCQHHFPFDSMSDTLNWFSQKRKFPSRYARLNTFTFGKQTKDNFINRKVQRRPTLHTHSFTHFGARFSFGESRGGNSPGRTRNTSRPTACNFR